MSRFIALDAEQGQLYVASVIIKGTAVKFEKAISIAGIGALTPANAGDIGRRVKEALKEAGIAPAPVVASVGRERVVLKEIKYPANVATADEPALVRFQVSKELAEGGDNVVIDYFALPTPDPDGQRRALAFAARKDVLAAFKTACQAAGLKLAGVTPRPFGIAASLMRAIKDGAVTPPESVNSPIAILVRGDKWGELVILRGGHVAFTRSLTGLALNAESAMLGEIKRNLAVFAGQWSQPVQALYVAEGDMPGGWAGRVQAGLTIPVQAFDPIAGVETDVPPEARGCFAGLAGLASLRGRSAELPVNFIEPREPKTAKDPNKRMLVMVAASIFVLMVAGLAAGRMMVSSKADQVKALRMEKNEIEDDIKNMEESMKRIKVVKEWQDKNVNWLDELYDLTARFPDPRYTEVVQLIGKPNETKNTNAKYVAEIELNIHTEGGKHVDDLANLMVQDRHYAIGSKLSKGAVSGGRGAFLNVKNQQFILKANIERRPPDQYVEELKASPGRHEKKVDSGDDFLNGGLGGLQ